MSSLCASPQYARSPPPTAVSVTTSVGPSNPVDRQIGGQPEQGALGPQLQRDRGVVAVAVGGVEDRSDATGVSEPDDGGVLDLDESAQRELTRLPADLFDVAEVPLQQVQSVDGLVDQHSAAGLGPGAAPGPPAVVGRVAVPGDARPAAEDAPQSTRSRATRVFAGRWRCSGSGSRRRSVPGPSSAAASIRSASATVVATGFSSRTCTPGLQRLDSHRSVQVVRRADVHDVRPFPLEHRGQVVVGAARRNAPPWPRPLPVHGRQPPPGRRRSCR